ncbi:MAG: hypothetical protein JJ899_09755 [Alphaproteobacteria bacterium]|nr:hypothetical protein [Alphaproteobacteria bacterium]
MAIYRPKPIYSALDKHVIRALAGLLAGSPEPEHSSANLAPDMLLLSDKQAQELLDLLGQLIATKEFRQKSAFVEEVLKGTDTSELNAKNLYLDGRKLAGKKRVMASAQWANYLARLGKPTHGHWRQSVAPMEFEYFESMEWKLLSSLSLNSRVSSILFELVKSHERDVLDAIETESGAKPVPTAYGVSTNFIANLESLYSSNDTHHAVPSSRVASILTIMIDFGVLFTTRDWSVAGTMSVIAGCFVSATT